jgi:hypothetical protein
MPGEKNYPHRSERDIFAPVGQRKSCTSNKARHHEPAYWESCHTTPICSLAYSLLQLVVIYSDSNLEKIYLPGRGRCKARLCSRSGSLSHPSPSLIRGFQTTSPLFTLANNPEVLSIRFLNFRILFSTKLFYDSTKHDEIIVVLEMLNRIYSGLLVF